LPKAQIYAGLLCICRLGVLRVSAYQMISLRSEKAVPCLKY